MACIVEKAIEKVNAFTIAPCANGVWRVTRGIRIHESRTLRLSAGHNRLYIPVHRDTYRANGPDGHLYLYRGNLHRVQVGKHTDLSITAIGDGATGTLIRVQTRPNVIWPWGWVSHFTKTKVWPGVEPSQNLVAGIGNRRVGQVDHLVWLTPGHSVLCADSAGVVAEITGAGDWREPKIARATKAKVHTHLQQYMASLDATNHLGHRWCTEAMKELARA